VDDRIHHEDTEDTKEGRSAEPLFLLCMKQVHITTQSEWRLWLAENHDRERDGIWLVYHKRGAGRPSLEYEESVEEALCFGWIDSVIKRIDDDT
jgi:uncharacterized protein YdeI (YjbR/CyaY-like superfamily)